MKRMVIMLVALALLATSCGLFTTTATGTITSTNPTVNALTGAVAAPHIKNLKVTQDPGTGLYGYLNEYGVWVIAPQFIYARNFDTDLGIAIVEPRRGFYGAINVFGQTVIEFNFSSSYDVEAAMSSMKKGRYVGIDLWEQQDHATGLYGYLNYYGQWHIAPQFTYAKAMHSEGLAVVEFKDGGWGAIDRTGKIVIQPNFRSSYDAEDALQAIIGR